MMTEPVKTVFATRRISQGTVIQQYMFSEKRIPKEYMQPKAFQSIKDLFTSDSTAGLYIVKYN
jgi:hypothetical protein